MDMALLVPGGSGQLGREIVALAPRGTLVRAPARRELDLTAPGRAHRAVAGLVADATARGLAPVVLNAAAYTAVDAAETDARAAYAANADGPALLAAACAACDVPLLHVSTDAVFPGDADRPYDVDDRPAPLSVYGHSKLAGERAVLDSGARAWVVRTSWVYGVHGGSFVRAVSRMATNGNTMSVVDDQRAAPTWSADLAVGLLGLAESVVAARPPGSRVLHCTGGGDASRYDLARAVFAELGENPRRVRPCATAEFPRPARRAAYSVLSNETWHRAGLPVLRHWRAALAVALPAIVAGESVH
jgi:dTDP-4-dehydrorhamnose reductase